MAFVSKKRNGYVIRVAINGMEKKISGFTNRREADRMCDKIEQLVTSRKTGTMPAELACWVAETAVKGKPLYQRLMMLGLVDSLPEKHTLAELFAKHTASRQDVTEETRATYLKAEANLTAYFGADCEVESITYNQADAYAVWLRETPLNRRKKGVMATYSEATVNRRISMTKQILDYAKRLGWVAENPFQFLRGGTSVNPEKWFYVDVTTAESVIYACPLPKWRAIFTLGRFAGVRGSSELFNLTWADIHWSSPAEPGSLIIKAEKNKRHGRKSRTVPMLPIVERELAVLFENAKEGETHVFPGMKKQTNFSTMTQKIVTAAGIPLWPSIWYNLRKSFCCDLMQAGLDPTVYEAITDHSYTIAMKHYQIAHTARLEEGYRKFFHAWGTLPATGSAIPGLTNPPNGNPPASSLPFTGAGFGDGFGAAHRIASPGATPRRHPQTPINYDPMQENKNTCDHAHVFLLGGTGLYQHSSNTAFHGVW